MSAPVCPICKKPVTQTPAFPFCSERCRLVDLGNWLGGAYRVAAPSSDEPDDEPVPDGKQESEDAT